MGAVLAARRLDDGAKLAVKLLASVRAHDARARADFAHEIWSLARLDHPGIVRIEDWGVVEVADPAVPMLVPGTPWLAMERAEGHLRAELYPTSWAELVAMLRQILDALAHAHARNVVHRDLKPSNVVWTADGRWKLADFGIAHALDRHAADTSWSRTLGTPAYMAPEQINGHWRDFGPWTDLFAVGALVYELVTGAPPFAELERKERIRAISERPIPAPGFTRFPVPDGFEGWLARLLTRSFLDRAQRAADVALWLDRLGPAPEPAFIPAQDARVSADATRTAAFEGLQTDAPEPRLLRDGPAAHSLPRQPIPEDWRTLATGATEPELVGLDRERDRIWAVLRELDAGTGARAIVLRGPRGSGRRTLARWAMERAHELGAAWQLVATHGDPPTEVDGVGGMLATFLRSVGLPRAELVERLRILLQLREGTGLEYVCAELILPAEPDEPVPLRLPTQTERNAAALAALQVLAGVLGGERDTAPCRSVLALIDEAHRAEEALGLVHLALAHRNALPTPLLFFVVADPTGPMDARLAAIEALDGVLRFDLEPLSEAALAARDERRPPRVDELRAEVAPGPSHAADPLEHAIRLTITGPSTTSDSF